MISTILPRPGKPPALCLGMHRRQRVSARAELLVGQYAARLKSPVGKTNDGDVKSFATRMLFLEALIKDVRHRSVTRAS